MDPEVDAESNIKVIDDRAQQDAQRTATIVLSEIQAGSGAPRALKRLEESVQTALESYGTDARGNPAASELLNDGHSVGGILPDSGWSESMTRDEYDSTSAREMSRFRASYMRALGKELLVKGVLPELAVAHGLNVVDETGRGITRTEIGQLSRAIGPGTESYRRNNELRFMFTRTLGDLYHEIRLQHPDIVGKWPIIGGGHELNEITRADLETFLSRAREGIPRDSKLEAQTPEQTANFKIAEQLLRKPNSTYVGYVVFDLFDSQKGQHDGKISKDDLKSYINVATSDSPRHRAIKFLYENWDSPQVKLMRDGNFITRDGLVRGTGYPNMTELRTEVWRQQVIQEEREQQERDRIRQGDRTRQGR